MEPHGDVQPDAAATLQLALVKLPDNVPLVQVRVSLTQLLPNGTEAA